MMTSDFSTAYSAFYIGYMSVFYTFMMAFSVVSYILTSKGLYAIAKRRGIERPWLAWVPVGNGWLLGCISDQYRYVVHNQERNSRGQLMWLCIVELAMAAVILTMTFVMVLMAAFGVDDSVIMIVSMLMLLVSFVVLAVAVVYTVVYYKATFDLFRSCDPEKSLLFLLIGIFTTYPMPFFVYFNRNKDLGMPPRQEATPLPETE